MNWQLRENSFGEVAKCSDRTLTTITALVFELFRTGLKHYIVHLILSWIYTRLYTDILAHLLKITQKYIQCSDWRCHASGCEPSRILALHCNCVYIYMAYIIKSHTTKVIQKHDALRKMLPQNVDIELVPVSNLYPTQLLLLHYMNICKMSINGDLDPAPCIYVPGKILLKS